MGQNTVVTDAPKDWKDFITDPGFAVIFGMVILLSGLGFVCFCPTNNTQAASTVFTFFAAGVGTLITAHVWGDKEKIKSLNNNQNTGNSNGGTN